MDQVEVRPRRDRKAERVVEGGSTRLGKVGGMDDVAKLGRLGGRCHAVGAPVLVQIEAR